MFEVGWRAVSAGFLWYRVTQLTVCQVTDAEQRDNLLTQDQLSRLAAVRPDREQQTEQSEAAYRPREGL